MFLIIKSPDNQSIRSKKRNTLPFIPFIITLLLSFTGKTCDKEPFYINRNTGNHINLPCRQESENTCAILRMHKKGRNGLAVLIMRSPEPLYQLLFLHKINMNREAGPLATPRSPHL